MQDMSRPREIRDRCHCLCMNVDAALNRFCTQNPGIGLFVDHLAGLKIEDLAARCARSESWINERIEAARLCLERQIRFELTGTPSDLTAA
jgi:hypothetical protein